MRAILLILMVLIAAPGAAQERYWQCAAFAREFSGIGIRGDAWTWWTQAEGRYARGSTPRVGSVIAFTPTATMRLGHVATVTRIVSDRELTITHANWSPIDGVRGKIERDVTVRDVSPGNDWSMVRVWYAPIGALGTTAWPVTGFIHADRPQPERLRAAPRLAYAPLDKMEASARPRRPLLGNDIIRLAQRETALARRF